MTKKKVYKEPQDFMPFGIMLSASIKPYTRMTGRGAFVVPKALAYQASKHNLSDMMVTLKHNIMIREETVIYETDKGLFLIPSETPFGVSMIFVNQKSVHYAGGGGRNSDLDNMVKAVFDAGNYILYEDDRWADHFTADRLDDPDISGERAYLYFYPHVNSDSSEVAYLLSEDSIYERLEI